MRYYYSYRFGVPCASSFCVMHTEKNEYVYRCINAVMTAAATEYRELTRWRRLICTNVPVAAVVFRCRPGNKINNVRNRYALDSNLNKRQNNNQRRRANRFDGAGRKRIHAHTLCINNIKYINDISPGEVKYIIYHMRIVSIYTIWW